MIQPPSRTSQLPHPGAHILLHPARSTHPSKQGLRSLRRLRGPRRGIERRRRRLHLEPVIISFETKDRKLPDDCLAGAPDFKHHDVLHARRHLSLAMQQDQSRWRHHHRAAGRAVREHGDDLDPERLSLGRVFRR